MVVNINEIFNISKSILLKPVDTIKKLKTKDYTYTDIGINLALISFFFAFYSIISSLFLGNIIEGLMTSIISFLVSLVLLSVAIFIQCGLYYLIAKVLNGKLPKFTTFLYLFSCLQLPLSAFLIIGLIFSFIPFIGPIILLLLLLILSLAYLYYLILLIRETFEISTLKAIIVWAVIPLTLLFFAILFFVILLLLGR